MLTSQAVPSVDIPTRLSAASASLLASLPPSFAAQLMAALKPDGSLDFTQVCSFFMDAWFLMLTSPHSLMRTSPHSLMRTSPHSLMRTSPHSPMLKSSHSLMHTSPHSLYLLACLPACLCVAGWQVETEKLLASLVEREMAARTVRGREGGDTRRKGGRGKGRGGKGRGKM